MYFFMLGYLTIQLIHMVRKFYFFKNEMNFARLLKFPAVHDCEITSVICLFNAKEYETNINP